MKVKDIMRAPVITIGDTATLREAVALLSSARVGGLPVLNDNGELVGIVTEYDIIKAIMPTYEDVISAEVGLLSPDVMEDRAYQVRDMPIISVMTKNPIAVEESDSILKAASAMIMRRFRWLPVVKDRKPIGIVSRIDILQALMRGKAT